MTTRDEPNDPTSSRETTGQGYPEEQPAGMGIDPKDHAEDDVVDGDDAPRTSPKRDGDAGQATGNPRAAGSEEHQ